jgi:HEAT repeat protein
MAAKRKKPSQGNETEVPKGYTPEQWAAYQADPVGYCIKELANPDATVRFNAVDILRGCAGDAKAAIPSLCEVLRKDKDDDVRAQAAWALQEICERVDVRAAK